MSIFIYKSSAGSGKTYTLAKEYLTLALSKPEYYKKILAVTFTNKAAEEMKSRVLEYLFAMSQNNHELVAYFSDYFHTSQEKIIQLSSHTLSHLIHHYEYFAISTIDKFFLNIIHSFTQEMGLKGSFGIEMDTSRVVKKITERIFENIENNKILKNWLIAFSLQKLHENKKYDTHYEIKKLAEELFTEQYKSKKSKVTVASLEKFKKEMQHLHTLKNQIEKKLENFKNAFKEIIESEGLSNQNDTIKKAYAGFFDTLVFKIKNNKPISESIKGSCTDASLWILSKAKNKPQLENIVRQKLMPLLNEAVSFYQSEKERYLTLLALLEIQYPLGIITYLEQQLTQYKNEEDVIMISDINYLLKEILNDSDTPFVYEKVGNKYHHFLIDEFQDTSFSQWENFKPLLRESLAYGHKNIMVGDAKQSIYSFRGGNPNILISEIQDFYPEAQSLSDNQINWRSVPEVVYFNNRLFGSLPQYFQDKFTQEFPDYSRNTFTKAYSGVEQKVCQKNSMKSGVVDIRFYDEKNFFHEWALQNMVDKIEALRQKNYSFQDMAILVRKNNDAKIIVDYILAYNSQNERKIPVMSENGLLLQNASTIKLLIAAFTYLLDPNDDFNLAQLTFFYSKLVENCPFENHDDFLNITKKGRLPSVFLENIDEIKNLPIFELTEVLIRCFELNAIKKEIVFLQAFLDFVLDFSNKNLSDLSIFLEVWEEKKESQSVKMTESKGIIPILTIHKSKGLQFPFVFVPFCNYDFTFSNKTAWVSVPQSDPYHFLNVVPIHLKKEWLGSAFCETYKNEKENYFLEILNALYVAFTRAEKGLFVYFPAPNKNGKCLVSLLLHYFNQSHSEYWNKEENRYLEDKLLSNVKEESKDKSSSNISLHTFQSHKWRNKLKVKAHFISVEKDEGEKERKTGIILHQILSEIVYEKDLEPILDSYFTHSIISASEKELYHSQISKMWENERIKSWFSTAYEIQTEVSILTKTGDSKRLDRVMIDVGNALILDYKSGIFSKHDEHQMKEYKVLLTEMGYHAQGFIYYFQDAKLIEI